uniref:Uncharacterized protein n=1 Tax=Anguilla anguilla TaxID=7936 RepID=A0A0E9VF46_ANGAN
MLIAKHSLQIKGRNIRRIHKIPQLTEDKYQRMYR